MGGAADAGEAAVRHLDRHAGQTGSEFTTSPDLPQIVKRILVNHHAPARQRRSNCAGGTYPNDECLRSVL